MAQPTPHPAARSPDGDRFDLAFRHAPIGMALVGLDGRFLDVNPALRKILGYDGEALEALTFQEITHPDDLDEDVRQAERVARGEIPWYRMEKRYVHRDGSTVWIDLTVALVRDAAGQPVCFLAQIQDISERRASQEALRRSEARYRALFRDSADAIFITDAEGVVLDVNQASLDLFGFALGDVVGSTAARFYHRPADRDALLERLAAGGSVTDFQVPLVRGDGSVFEASLSASVVTDAEGVRRGYQGIVRDVTENRRLAEALRKSEEYFRTVIETSTDTLTVLDRDGRILYDSPSVVRVLGHHPSDRKGHLIFEWVHPDDVGRVRDAFRQALERPGEALGTEMRVRDVDGEWRWVSLAGRNLLDDPAVNGVVIHKRDVTARRRAEEEVRTLVAMTLAMVEAEDTGSAYALLLDQVAGLGDWAVGEVWAPDPRGLLVRGADWDDGTHEAARFVEESRDVQFRPGEGLPGETWEARCRRWMADVAGDPGFRRRELAARAGLRAALAMPLLSHGEPVAVAVFFSRRFRELGDRDIEVVESVARQIGVVVERVRGREQLVRAAEELRRSNEELERFAYVASHDLQEPLRMVASYTQLLSRRYRGQLDEDADTFIDHAVDGAVRMQNLINALLEYSRIKTRRRPFEAVALDKTLDAVLANLRTSIEEAGAMVERGPLPVVMGDPLQLMQLLQNLVSNAIKFRRGPGVRVSVSASMGERRSTVRVSDDGIGIAAEYGEAVFEPFRRLHGTGSYAGTGIGLAIAKRIVERHGGSIAAESNESGGTTLRFTVPLASHEAPGEGR